MIRRGMILSAGLGTRLDPITQSLPKPLVPVLNIPSVVHSIDLLKRSGIREIVINLHHLSNIIETYLGNGERWDVDIHYSKEETLLGTGGGIKHVEPFFRKERFVVANCDFASNIDLIPLIKTHIESGAHATMVLFKDDQHQKDYAPVGVDPQGKICVLPGYRRAEPIQSGIFTGVHILEPEILSLLKKEPSGINDILYPRLMKENPNCVLGQFVPQGTHWFDTGDLLSLWTSSINLLKLLNTGEPLFCSFLKEMGDYREFERGLWHKEPRFPEGATWTPPVIIGEGCTIERDASIGPYVILSNNSFIGKGAHLSHFIGLNEAHIAPWSVHQKLLLYDDSTLIPPTAITI